MKAVTPVTLAAGPVRLVPLTLAHEAGLQAAAADGELWHLRFTSVPAPDETRAYIDDALAGQAAGHRLPFAVLDAVTGDVLGSTSYHDIVPAVERVEIGYTWYAQRTQRTAINTTAKLLLLTHAFETLGAKLVGWRTDNFNHASQRAIERLGAKRDGVLRHHALRRDGTVRDTVMYSLAAGEWPEVKAHLNWQLTRQRT
jgi:RimJ/RimL family protein N-acetyltransferase